MFRYLGALVLHGVFEYITVSTLLVGHTHDIVDQMFSVWSKLLRIHDAETYEKMRALFHDKYHKRVAGLAAMMRGDLEAAAAADADLNADAAAEVVEEERQGLHGPHRAAEWDSKAAERLANFAVEMSRETGMQPEITLQTLSVNVQAWLSQANGASKAPDRQLANIGTPHVFAVEKDPESGDVYLYNKFLVSSTSRSDRGERHLYMSQQSGSYTSRALLYRADEVITIDPSRNPPLKVDTEELRDTVDAYGQLEAMGPPEIKQYCAMLDRLDQAQSDLADICVECKKLIESLNSIGVVRRGKHASQADLEAARRKDKERVRVTQQLEAHIADPAFAEQHGRLVVHGWWTKWLHRAKHHILPAFVERGVVVNPAHRDLSYHIHPSALVSNGAEPPLFESDTRVDVSWLREHGAPKQSHIAIVRSNDPKTPLWLCEIVGRVVQQEASGRGAEEAAAGSEAAGPASGRAASASGFGYHHYRDRARLAAAGPSLSELPPFQVKWWDLYASDCTRLKLLDDAHWEDLFQRRGTSAREILRHATADEHPHFPRWLVDQYQSVHFAAKTPVHLGEVPATSLIVWGPLKKMVTATHKIKPAIWQRVQRDLTEGSKDGQQDPAPDGGRRGGSQPKRRKASHSPGHRGRKAARAASPPPSSVANSAAAAVLRVRPSRAAAIKASASIGAAAQSDDEEPGHSESEGAAEESEESEESEQSEEAEEADHEEAEQSDEDVIPLTQLAAQSSAPPAPASTSRASCNGRASRSSAFPPAPTRARARAAPNKQSGRTL